MNIKPVHGKILVVDDELLNIEVMSGTLEDLGEVLFATNGAEAIDLCLREKPDIIILDIMMPEMDGFEVCRRLKQMPETSSIPIIFATAMTDNTDEAKGFEIGAVDYISKPIVAPVVVARVKNHLQLKQYRDSVDRNWKDTREDQIKATAESAIIREREQCLGAIGAVLAAALRQIVRPRHDCPPGVLRIAQSHGSKDLLGRLDALQRLRRLLSAGVHEPLALESGFLQIIAAT